MPRMIQPHRIALLGLLSCATWAFAQSSPQLIPLQDYINQVGVEKDPAALGYIASRCSALYADFAKGMEGESDPQRQKAKDDWTQIAERFMGRATQMMMSGTTIEFKDALQREASIVVKLGNIYTERIEATRLRTNNMFDDSLIAGDFKVCATLAKTLQ
jgi:hypothetical protein